jgi:DNA-binding winged helix-turn-helix (wHTH) protein/TolB-like protein
VERDAAEAREGLARPSVSGSDLISAMTVALSFPVEKRQYRFDDFVVDPVRRRLVRAGEAVTITPKAFSILLILLERRGEAVDKEELIRRVWPDTFVSEANLTQNVSSLRKALGEKANEHRYVITVPGCGYSFTAEVEEEAVPSSRAEIPIQAFPAPTAPPPALPGSRGWLAIAVLVLLMAGVAAALLIAREPPAVSAGGGEARPSLAVLGFRNLSGAPASEWLGPALAEMLSTELAAGGRVRVSSRENVARARQSPESLDPESLRRLHRILGCELLVVGAYLPLGNGEGARIRLDLRVLRLPGGETAASLAEVGTVPELFELVARTSVKLRQALGLAELSPEQARAVRALQPASPEAARLYSEGLERLRAFDTPRAVDLLRQAAEADPGSATIRSALAQAWRHTATTPAPARRPPGPSSCQPPCRWRRGWRLKPGRARWPGNGARRARSTGPSGPSSRTTSSTACLWRGACPKAAAATRPWPSWPSSASCPLRRGRTRAST